MFRTVCVCIFTFLFAGSICAQSIEELDSDLKAALTKNDRTTAIVVSEKLFDLAHSSGEMETAGRAAFAQASVFESLAQHSDAAEAYENCADSYEEAGSIAQSLQCKYMSGKAWLAGGKRGQGLKTLIATSEALKRIGQEKSMMAADVYLTLSKEALPSKLEKRAHTKRRNVIEYAELSIAALTANGKDKSKLAGAAFFNKGMALEDDEAFKDAVMAYENALEIFRMLPGDNSQIVESAATRLSIAKAMSKGLKRRSNVISVDDAAGNSVELSIKRKRDVVVPRIDRNRVVDGARATVTISLDSDGSVKSVDITESYPNPEFGEALKKAVLTWKFTPPDGIAAENIPPFEYKSTFFVSRN